MAKFKIGDRVVLCNTQSLHPYGMEMGMVGTILEDNEIPYVKFDNFTDGHDADGRSDRTDCWACMEERLELYKDQGE